MKRRSKKLRVLAWSATLASVVVIAAWIGSIWFDAQAIHSDGYGVGLLSGRLAMGRVTPFGYSTTWVNISDEPRLKWGSWCQIESWNSWTVGIPLWAVLLLSGGLAAFCWRREIAAKRQAVYACSKWRYDRAGLDPAAACPECGFILMQGRSHR